MAILITCEISGTQLPACLLAAEPFSCSPVSLVGDSVLPPQGLLPPHDRWGAMLAGKLSRLLSAPLIQFQFHPDVIDVSRSLHHADLFGPLTVKLPAEFKQQLVDEIYQPYRQRVEAAIACMLQQFTFVVHLSVRTFAAKSGGKFRRTDVGLLYDSSCDDERDLCLDWIDEAYGLNPNLRVRRNYPRRGTLDCLTKAMRSRFPPQQYLGIEVWLNRAWASRDARLRDDAIQTLARGLQLTIGMPIAEAA